MDAHAVKLKTGLYCLLNFDKLNESGSFQIQKALDAAGDQKRYLSFVAVDVELDKFRKTLSTDECIARIAEAIQKVRFEGLQPIIYTASVYWRKLTSNTREISGVPLWDCTKIGDRPYGTWTSRLGKQQYPQNVDLNQGKGKTFNADLDIFNPTAFSLPRVARGSAPSLKAGPSLTRKGKYIYLMGSISNGGFADALATRITTATLNGISAQFTLRKTTYHVSPFSPYRMNTIPVGGSALLNLKFPGTDLRSGSQGILKISGTFCGKPFNPDPITVTIP